MPKDLTTVTLRAPVDLKKRLDEYADENDITKSEAGRELLARALEIENADKSPEELRDELEELEEELDQLTAFNRPRIAMRLGAIATYIGILIFMMFTALSTTSFSLPFRSLVLDTGLALIGVGFLSTTAGFLAFAGMNFYHNMKKERQRGEE
jgi:hypothetical protein